MVWCQKNILNVKNRKEFRQWLVDNHCLKRECWVQVKRGKPIDDVSLYYLDAVEEALCFDWIDNICKRIDGQLMQRFAPRRQNSHWTELNKERVRRLEKLGVMTDAGRVVLPDMGEFTIDDKIKLALQNAGAWEIFKTFPQLYQRIRISNLVFRRGKIGYEKSLQYLIKKTKEGKMFGKWDDYGRLTDCFIRL